MAERTLRGSRLGSQSLETDAGIQLAPRFEAIYDLPDGRIILVPFAAGAPIPQAREAPDGTIGHLRNAEGEEEETKPERRQRTHWDMHLERRTKEELEELLNERLELLRKRRRSAS